jgi:hypothetical protein
MLQAMRLIVLISLLSLSGAPAAEVYKWVDEEGNIVYSDQPRPGAEELENLEIQTYRAPRERRLEPEPEPLAPVKYESIGIVSPANDATIRDNSGNISVSVALTPPLMVERGHRLSFRLNGQAPGEPQTGTTFQFQNVDRGTHTLSVAVVDASGAVVGSSDGVVVHLHRATANKKVSPTTGGAAGKKG